MRTILLRAGREWADSYPPFAVKDSLHFALHDLQHAEKLVEAAFYCEQVGLLHRMAAVQAWLAGGGSALFDKQLRQDVGHVISDMNSCCLHLLDFLLVRFSCASKRTDKVDQLQDEYATVTQLLFGDRQPARCGESQPGSAPSFDVSEVRSIFHEVGCRQLARQVGEEDEGRAMEGRWPLVASEKEEAGAG